MSEQLSDQLTNIEVDPNDEVKPNEFKGRKRIAYASYTVPATPDAVSDTIALFVLDKGARITGGRLIQDGLSAASGEISIGIAGDTTKYLGATATSSAGATDFANTAATNFLSETTARERIFITVLTSATVIGNTIQVTLEYVVD